MNREYDEYRYTPDGKIRRRNISSHLVIDKLYERAANYEYQKQTIVLSMIYAFENQLDIHVKMISNSQNQPYVLQSGETMDYILECGYYLARHLSEKKFNNTKENNWKALNIYYISKLAITDYRINNANFPILYVNSLNSISYSKLGLGMNDIYIIFKNYVLVLFRKPPFLILSVL